MDLKIFDVQHGACALLTCDNEKRIMIDCGQNSETGWRPGNYLSERGISHIEQLVITNYDEDHADGLVNLRSKVTIGNLLRNRSVSPETLQELKSEDGIGNGIAELAKMSAIYTVTPEAGTMEAMFPNVEKTVFYNLYPKFDDENNLSVAVFFKISGKTFLFPGDLEKAGWEELLKNKGFRDLLPTVDVLIASHHGRENGICEAIFDVHGCKPFLVVISDKGYQHDTQLTVPYYRSKVKGANLNGKVRHVLTTRSDGTIRFRFSGNDWFCDLNYDIEKEKPRLRFL